ncbi:glycoside hydrolase family 2 protein [Leadbettera azotonutricia]|uniref:Beta-galactosidase n=1 Tax=Leadbettera azotonutricia (strain ATCC BAA-888 / DSM 13862 / ZAS-9) TaxID=545695 RepID=F5YBQ4_LEAAZ|nr:glycoside hydrolase family 2 [Leadbettera azotonutricia]AEF82541.1 beta-galactosidase [Leadbettera azotonutricia ZAS-9]
MQCYQPNYPRPQFVRDSNSWENLNGPWDFAFDDKNEGTAAGWFSAFPSGKKITVPFTYETSAGGIGDEAPHNTVWYRKALTIEKAKLGDKRIVLHFEGCDYIASVWVNGGFAGGHKGGYARFSLDITNLSKNGENIITVKAEDSFSLFQPRGKQRWRNENFGCWYVQTTGIWKTVWLEYVSDDHIASVKMTPVLSSGKIEIEAEVRASVSEAYELEASISFKGIPVTSVTVPVTKDRLCFNADLVSTSLTEWGIRTWGPGHPDLYDISFKLLKNGKAIDEALSYFGMREIRIDGPNVLLNGSPLYQRLILDQGYWKESHLTPPSEEALIADIDKVMAAGYNGVRKHQKIEDEKFLYWADVKGLLVWSEMAATYEFGDEAVTNFTREWMEIVRQNYNHPSIITWTPFNESWGVPQIKTDITQQRFTEAIYYLTKSYDPYRPVICNDGWEHTISDIITLHDYEEKGEDFLDRYGDKLDDIFDNMIYHNKFKSAFAGNYKYKGQPVILSEFGGIAFNNGESGWGYGNKVKSKDDYIKRFDSITTAIKEIDYICGFCYTQVTDVQQEINGIMDMDRNFKVEPEILKEINERQTGSIHRIVKDTR